MPETLSVSCVIAVMSDSDSCVFVAMRARTCPTRRCAITSTGSRITATIVICQLSTIIATSAAITVTVLPMTLWIGVAQHAGDAADVVLQARLDDAGLRAGEEAELHGLQVREQPDAERTHDVVAHLGGEVGLPDAERATTRSRARP